MNATCRIALRVTPRSAKPGVGEWREGVDGRRELELRVAAAPADGAANAEVVRLLAKALGAPQKSVVILSGHASRHKRVEVELLLDEVMRRLGLGVSPKTRAPTKRAAPRGTALPGDGAE